MDRLWQIDFENLIRLGEGTDSPQKFEIDSRIHIDKSFSARKSEDREDIWNYSSS